MNSAPQTPVQTQEELNNNIDLLMKERYELLNQIGSILTETYELSDQNNMIFNGAVDRKETRSVEDLIKNIQEAAGPGGIDTNLRDSMLSAIDNENVRPKINRILELKIELENLKGQLQ